MFNWNEYSWKLAKPSFWLLGLWNKNIVGKANEHSAKIAYKKHFHSLGSMADISV